MIYFCCQSQRECPPVAPQHFVFTFFPSDIASLGYCLPSLCFDKSVWNMCTCLRTILNVCVCVCVSGHHSLSTQPCVWLSDAPCPQQWHHAPRTCTEFWKTICLLLGLEFFVLQWQDTWSDATGRPAKAWIPQQSTINLSVKCCFPTAVYCHITAKNAHPPYGSDTLCLLQQKKDGSSRF